MRSKLYEGKVWHQRERPSYGLAHSVFYLDLDLAELDRVAQEVGLFAHNRFNLLSLHDSDYDALASRRRTGLDGETGCQADDRVSLLTIPRILGYVFNPVSFLMVRDARGSLKHLVAEVHNTWGERHIYELARSNSEGSYRAETAKAFYVSPFLEGEAGYDFELQEGADGSLRITIRESTDAGHVFSAGLDLAPRDLSRRNLLRALVRYPLLNLKVIGAIHWHALRIWLRGARFHPHRKAPKLGSGTNR